MTEPGAVEPVPRFLSVDRQELRGTERGDPLRHVTRSLDAGVRDLIAALDLRSGDRLLDFGCADRPYRRWLPEDVEYLGADIDGNPAADVAVRADGTIDLESETVDAVLSTQVLEHALDPAVYLAEAFRVIMPGGALALTTHGLMRLHRDPVDLWRWTSDGLIHQVRLAGFDVVRHWGIVGAAATGIQLFQDSTVRRLPARLRRPYTAVLQTAAAWVDGHQSQAHKDLDAMVFAVLATRSDRST